METNPLSSALILLSSGVVSMGLSRQLSLNPVVAFFAVGAVVGRHGFELVDHETGALHMLAELGVCFLLFDVGLHLSFRTLVKQWKSFLFLGLSQTIICGALIAAAATVFGLPANVSAIIGLTLSLSSTALVLKLLRDHKEEESPVGHKATEILVFQDLAAIFLLVILSSLQNGDGDALHVIGRAALSIVAAIVFVAIAGRILLRPFFAWVIAIKSDEVFTASALLFVLFTCWVTQELGLSLALGAFLAGVTLSECTYSYLVRAEITPFRGLVLSLFFLTIGMSLDLPLMFSSFHIILGLTLGMMALKICGLILAAKITKIDCDAAIRLAFVLSQGSEFAFVILALCISSGLIGAQLAGLLSGAIGLSLLLTPLVAGCGCFLSRCSVKMSREDKENIESAPVKGEVVIVGFDDIGRAIATALVEIGIPYRGHDRDWEQIAYAKSRGFNIYYSDPDRPRTLSRASVGEVRAVICLSEDDAIVRLLVEGLAKVAPNVPFLGATGEPARLNLYHQLGVEDVYLRNEQTAKNLFRALLERLGYSPATVEEAVARGFAEEEEAASFFPRPALAESIPIGEESFAAAAA